MKSLIKQSLLSSLAILAFHALSSTAFATPPTITSLPLIASYSQLHAFDGTNDGSLSQASLVQGTDGRLYGTTVNAGASNWGTAFAVNPDGTGFTTLHSFANANDGASPAGNLIQGTDGRLYGTAAGGGAYGAGTVFAMNLDGTGFTTLYSFQPSNGIDGTTAQAGLIQGTGGRLYGTTQNGGVYSVGTVFAVNPDGTGFATLYSFTGGNDGSSPLANLVLGTDGRLYGTTISGGANGFGTVFAVNTDGTGFTTLYTFTNGNDGALPSSALIQGTDGRLYGTALEGGINNFGTIFAMNLDGTGFTTLYGFTNGNDGSAPVGNLIQEADGRFYGAAQSGGINGTGTLFVLNPDGTGFGTLYSFTGGNDGAFPQAALIQGADGRLYGTAAYGGASGNGTVFAISTTSATAGNTTTITVTVTGTGPFSYQWKLNGVDIPGATSATLTLANVGLADAGSYTVFVSNLEGSATSNSVTLTVLLPPPPSAPVFAPAPGTYRTAQSVNITSAGAILIYYTTDGSTPTIASTLYTGPVSIAATAKLSAIGVAAAGSSPVTSGTYTILPPSAPVFTPAPGTYPTAQPVSITSANATHIYYTTNGSTPTTASTLYTGSIFISATTTLNAIGVDGAGSSPVTSGTYTIVPPSAPVFTPAPGTYPTAQLVSITSANSTLIYYTTDGTTPTTASTLYTGTILISTTTTLSAIGVDAASLSPVTSGTYTILPPTAPVFSPAPGTYSAAQSVSITSTAATSIYYTTNGTTPTTASILYTGPVSITATTTLRAIDVDAAGSSSVTSGTYTILSPSAPVFTPVPGTYPTAQSVSITSANATSIYYTTNGTMPTMVSTLYTGPVSIAATTTLRAIGIDAAGSSPVTSGTYTILPPPSAPVFSPAPSTYSAAQSVSITSAGATSIYYTTNGTTPTTSSTLYAGPVSISTTTTLRAIGVNTSGSSAVTSGIYTILPPPTAPVFSPVPGTYSAAQSVSITSAGATSIYYTTNGTTPTTASTLYTGAISISTTTTLSAIGVNANGSSPVTSGTYTIAPPSAPVFSPVPGTYSTAQSVSITSAGATSIYYTTNGSTPTTASTLYTGPISISTTTTLRAIGVNAAGSSPVTSGTYTIGSTTPPKITAGPKSQTVCEGANVTFTVCVTSALPVTYQWRFNCRAIPCATGATLTLHDVTLANAGAYTVVVTNRNGSTTSAIAQLTVQHCTDDHHDSDSNDEHHDSSSGDGGDSHSGDDNHDSH
ncbi:MAG TPA: chitobiase/beta-hexosaminidase C-terminal domain-containing protein [Opitutaceae bacterium]|nr:chitobiase/beta-hexosaminidase C-terminal domain-containing protein [Opitutaceae bacterium]